MLEETRRPASDQMPCCVAFTRMPMPTDAGMSYDCQGLVITERWQTEEHYEFESQAEEALSR